MKNLAMRTYLLSTLLGLTTTVSISTSLPVRAASFDLNQLKDISSRPIDSEDSLNFFGDPSQNQGYTAFFNLNPTALDFGHEVTSLNGVGNAPYYVTGREGSPEIPPSGATRATTLTEIAGFSTFSSSLKSYGISLDSIGLGFGQKSDLSFTQTWNLGNDILGEDWFASPSSNVEEKIYKANPDDVEEFLALGTQKIVSFGYSDIYAAINYGSTTSVSDDSDIAFTDPMTATKVAGLDPVADALANAFLQDVADGGGKVQLFHEENQPDESNFAVGNGFGGVNLRFQASIRAVHATVVPEPSSVLGLLMVEVFAVVFFQIKNRKKMRCVKNCGSSLKLIPQNHGNQ